MEDKSRQQMLETILKRFCQVRTLNYDIIDDLLSQMQSITTGKGDEEKSLLLLVRLAKKELRKYKQERSQTTKKDGLRATLNGIVNDLTVHMQIYFSDKVPPDSSVFEA